MIAGISIMTGIHIMSQVPVKVIHVALWLEWDPIIRFRVTKNCISQVFNANIWMHQGIAVHFICYN